MRSQFFSATHNPLLALAMDADWGPNDESLTGDEIWGAHGPFSAQNATSNFTYSQALFAVARQLAPWASEVREVDGGVMVFESAQDARTWEQQI